MPPSRSGENDDAAALVGGGADGAATGERLQTLGGGSSNTMSRKMYAPSGRDEAAIHKSWQVEFVRDLTGK